jgi:hypothetical protein
MKDDHRNDMIESIDPTHKYDIPEPPPRDLASRKKFAR